MKISQGTFESTPEALFKEYNEFAFIKCQEMRDDWKEEFKKEWNIHNFPAEQLFTEIGNSIGCKDDHDCFQQIAIPQIPPDLLTN